MFLNTSLVLYGLWHPCTYRIILCRRQFSFAVFTYFVVVDCLHVSRFRVSVSKFTWNDLLLCYYTWHNWPDE